MRLTRRRKEEDIITIEVLFKILDIRELWLTIAVADLDQIGQKHSQYKVEVLKQVRFQRIVSIVLVFSSNKVLIEFNKCFKI